MARILIVDDDEAFRSLARHLLTLEEHEVLTAEDAFGAIEIMESYRIDLALVDINMPFTNGFQLVETLRSSLRFKFLPIAFLTARKSVNDIKRASKSNVNGYIIKPIGKESFIKKVNELLKLTPARQQVQLEVVKSEMDATIKVCYPIKLEKITELGLILISDRKIAQTDDTVEIDSSLFARIGVTPSPMKVIAVKELEKESPDDPQLWKICLMYIEASSGFLQNVRNWIQIQSGKKTAS